MPRTLITPLAWLLFCLQLALVTVAQAGPAVTFLPATEPSFDKGILWRVESANGKSSYLLGTIHSEDPRVLDFSENFLRKLNETDMFAMELVPDLPTLAGLTE